MGCGIGLQRSHCLALHSFPWCSLGTCGEAFPRQCPGLCWGEHVPGTVPTGTLDVDTLVCGGRKFSPMEARQPALLGLSIRALPLACSPSKRSQQDKQEKGLTHDQSLLSQWTGKTLSDLPWNQNPGALKPRSWTLNWNISLTEWYFLLGLKAVYKLWSLGNIEAHDIQIQSLLFGFSTRFTSGNFARKTRNSGKEIQLP